MHASAIAGSADHAVHEVAPWIEKLARVGFLAKALLYMTIGALAAAAAFGLGEYVGGKQGAQGQRGAMGAILDAPFGRALLVVIAVGLFGYAAWRFVEAATNPEREHGAKGAAKRVRAAALGIIHVALGASAIKIAMGHRESANDGQQTSHWTARALESDVGRYALWAVAAGFVGYGLYEIFKAIKAKLNKRLALGRMSRLARQWVVGVSRFGIAARGVVFGMTGVLIARAIQNHNPQQVRGIKSSLGHLIEFGRVPFGIIALGLIAYGVYQILNAKYRRIDVG
jgi:hypothetical protein